MTITKPSPWICIQGGMYNIKYAQGIEIFDTNRMVITFVGRDPITFKFQHPSEMVETHIKLQKICKCKLFVSNSITSDLVVSSELSDEWNKFEDKIEKDVKSMEEDDDV